MKRTVLLLFVSFVASQCAGGGVDSQGSLAGDTESQYASEALVQFIPYEVMRNNIIQGLELGASSECIRSLDTDRLIFGAQSAGGSRLLGFSMTRTKKTSQLADTCCREALKNNYSLFFDAPASLDFNTMGRRIIGRPLNDEDLANVAKVAELNGYTSVTQRQHGACVALFSSFKANVQ